MITTALVCSLFIVISIICVDRLVGPSSSRQKGKIAQERAFTGFHKNKSSNIKTDKLLKKDTFSDIKTINRLLQNYSKSESLSEQLKRHGLKISVSSFYIGCILLAIIVFSLVNSQTSNWLISAISACAFYFLPFYYLKFLNKKYIAKFAERMPNALAILSNSIKVGQGIETGFSAIAKSDLKPVSTEFKKMQSKIQLGQSMEAALNELYKKIPIPEVKIFATGIKIHSELGGNLSESLGILEHTLRERFKVKREAKALSAQGIMSSGLLLCVPLVTAGLWTAADPNLMSDWLSFKIGKIMLGYCFVMYIGALILIKKIISVFDF